MKQIDYKGVIVRPRTVSFEEYHENEISYLLEHWRREKADPEHYIGDCYNKTEDEYRQSLEIWAGSERAYWDRQDHWFVTFSNGRVVRIPKKKYSETKEQFEARLDKVIAKVERENTTDYGKFAVLMQNLVNEKIGHVFGIIYPTTYGIGLWVIYNWNFKEYSEKIEGLLNTMGVEYYTEYSEANWVFRYKISKKEANRLLIQSNLN